MPSGFPGAGTAPSVVNPVWVYESPLLRTILVSTGSTVTEACTDKLNQKLASSTPLGTLVGAVVVLVVVVAGAVDVPGMHWL